MKTFLPSIILCLAFGSVSMGADISPEALDVSKGFAAKQETVLANLKTFDMSGTIKIVASDEFANDSIPPGPKVSQLRFRIVAGPEDLKETVETLDEIGKVARTKVYFLNQKRVILADNSDGHYFSIDPFVLAPGKSNGVFNDCPAFFEDAFLNLDITTAGVPAMLVSTLGSKEKWAQVVEKLQSAQIGSDGHVYATIAGTGTEGRSTIELIKQPNSTNDYQVASISFFADLAKDVVEERKIDVLNVSNQNNFGNVGKTYRMNIYEPPSAVPAVTWEYTITDMKVNCPVDDDTLQFYPLAVKNIDDAEKGCYVTAAK